MDEPEVIIWITPTGDKATAAPHAAALAATTLLKEASENGAGSPTASFFDWKGKLIKEGVKRGEEWSWNQ